MLQGLQGSFDNLRCEEGQQRSVKWGNTKKEARKIFSVNKREHGKTDGGPQAKPVSVAVNRTINLCNDSASFKGIEGVESCIFGIDYKPIDKVVVGKTYHFTNLSTRFFHTFTLTTTSSKDINDHEDLLDIADYQEESTSTTITGAITQIILHKSAQCGNCHKSIKDIPTGNLVRCNSCNMKQLKSNLNNAYSCKMNVKDLSTSQVIKLSMFSSILLTFLTENLKLSLLSEMEDVEDYLLEQQHLTITYNSGNKVVLNFRKQDDFASHILLDVCVLSLGYVYVT
ncbi:unnamed protein product [Mytilus edulis]|uniref:Uncharacterized protein n=1 Tax=Mytilus edulis TaxID=6550 RepID=A0A8S3UMF3_MYTED|nr:unnamed protein product [Mytilus edulis]